MSTQILKIGILLLLFGLSSCATVPRLNNPLSHAQNDYELTFVQSATSEYPIQAHYELRSRESGKIIATFASNIKIDERGVDDRQMRVGKEFNPTWSFSPSGRTLLITEDCWDAIPDNGYLLVQFEQNKVLRSVYLDIPPKLSQPPYGVQADILALNDHRVIVSYGSERQTFSLSELMPKS